MKKANNHKGFTLLELMIVVAIVGILGALVYPSFKDSIKKARRGDAIASLEKVQLAQVKYRANNATYSTSLTEINMTGANTSDKGWYTITLPVASSTTFEALATPQDDQVDDKCGKFRIDLKGPKTGAVGEADLDCWGIHN